MSRKTRQLIWSVPLVATLAIVGALALFMTLAPNDASAQDNTKPGRPMNLTATADGPTIIKLDWDAAEGGGGATGYRIDMSIDGIKWEEFVTNTGNSTTQYLHRGLVSQEMHYYRVFGVNSIDTGLVSATVTGRTEKSDAPDAPEDLEATARAPDDPIVAANFFIELEWTAPIDPVGAPVEAYLIDVSDDGIRWREFATDDTIEPGSTQMYPADVKFGGETRYYRVYALNTLHPDGTKGKSDASNTDQDTTVDGSVPANVDNLRVGVQPTSLDVWLYWDWEAPKTTPPLGTIPDDFRAVVQATRLGVVITPEEAALDAAIDPVTLTTLLGSTPAAEATWTIVEEISWSLDYESAGAQMEAAGLTPKENEVYAFRVLPKNKFGTAVVDTETEVVMAVLRSDFAPDNVDLRSIRKDDVENDGRSGLKLSWKSTSNNTDDPAYVAVVRNDYAVQYRIEVSDDGENWEQLAVEDGDVHNLADGGSDTVDFVETAGNVTPIDGPDLDDNPDFDANEQLFTQRELAAGTTKHYRAFAFVRSDPTSNDSPMIMGVPSRERSGETAGPLLPGTPTDLDARATGRTTIEVTWDPPEITDDGCDQDAAAPDDNEREDDGSECPGAGDSVITHYQIQVSDNGTIGWANLAEDVCRVLDKDGKATKVMETPSCTYTHTGMVPDTTKHYRAYAVNASGDGPVSSTDLDTTKLSEFPDVPGGFVGEAYGSTAVKLCWLAQSLDPADDPVHSYEIVISGVTDPVMVRAANADSSVPTQTTIMGLSPATTYTFTVRGVNNRGKTNESATETVTTEMADPPGAPTVTLGTVTDSEINLSWTRPASDGGPAITGWIVEKAYGGSFLDAERTNDDAFTDAQTWWDGLGCPDMVAAVMDDGTVDDTNPFCKMYAGLATAEEDEVERVFGARYDVIDDAAQTNATYSDLTPETAYMYRVAAVNAVGPGAWSNEVTATTLAVATTLGDASGLTATVEDSDSGAITVELSWTAGANANIHWVAGARKNADGTYDLRAGNTYWSQADMDGSHSVDTTGLNSGTYSFTVIAGQLADDDTENWDSAWVTPFAEVELP